MRISDLVGFKSRGSEYRVPIPRSQTGLGLHVSFVLLVKPNYPICTHPNSPWHLFLTFPFLRFCHALMEPKLTQNKEIGMIRSTVRRGTASNITPSPTLFINLLKNKKSLTNRFRALSQRWNFIQIQGLSKSPNPAKQFLVHVVKKGETLTSISMQYGVSMQAIVAANADIVDVDLVLEGQRLNIPPNAKEAQMDSASTKQLDHCNIHERCQSSSSILGAHENQRIFTSLSSQHIQLAKPTGYFLVLVPLIAFCIRCIIGTFNHRLPKQLKHQAVNESKGHHQRSRSERWKSVLIRESDVADAESRQDLVNPSDDQSQVPFEDISHAYTKLEPAYLKFLSECGMSKWGYWRGGSLE